MRAVLYRSAAIVLGVAAALLLLETGLWAVSVVAPSMLSRVMTAGGPDDALRVLCVGDSHTYGVMVEREEAYPARLQHHLGAAGLPARVWNLGIPGQNSRQVLHRLPDYLRRYRPHVLAVFVGTNNGWNVGERNEERSAWRRLAYRIRIVRFAQLLVPLEGEPAPPDERATLVDTSERAWRLGGEVVRNRPAADTAATHDRIQAWTADDLAAIVELGRAYGAESLLITYPWEIAHVPAVNAAVRAVAQETGALLVDSNALLGRQPKLRKKLLFEDVGLHPRPALYDEIASEAAQRIAERVVPATEAAAANADVM